MYGIKKEDFCGAQIGPSGEIINPITHQVIGVIGPGGGIYTTTGVPTEFHVDFDGSIRRRAYEPPIAKIDPITHTIVCPFNPFKY